MKIAVVIDYKKINRIKQMIETRDYVDYAVGQLAFQISLMFV